MIASRRLILGAATALLFVQGQAGDFFFRDGDRVVFLGDSITEQRLYTTYLEAYALTRYPQWNLMFRNVGWGGDTAWLRQRAHPDERALFAADPEKQQAMVNEAVQQGLERDVLPLRPTAVTIKFGMNDHSYQAFRPDIFGAYVRSQERLAQVLQGEGARLAFLTPQPIEDRRPDPDQDVRNISLRRFSDGLRNVAEKRGARFVDQFDPYMKIMLDARAKDSAAFIGGGDAVHPGPIGHTLMAWAILKGLNADALVSRVEIDTASGKVGKAERCNVESLRVGDGRVAFDRKDEALPMPIDTRAEAALKLAPVLEDLSRYELQVSGLAAGEYDVTIDGEAVGQFSSDALAAGVNLAGNAGPITSQARKVLDLVFQKNDLFFRRWRDVQLYRLPGWAQN
ncbi:MAG: SGNH/GDSL hydrolase family protein, partial [Verrucomicrobiales bacterium]|nr:SGNH/GDSL hydrolase family protein [Verrucomicrobiales bacterium]